MSDTISSLEALVAARMQDGSSSSSYVAQLKHKGMNKILEKVGEEAVEFILAAKDANTQLNEKATTDTLAEAADLIFHMMVSLSYLNLSMSDVLDVLAQRMHISGLEEKASRSKKE